MTPLAGSCVLVSDGITFGENTVLPTSYIYDENSRNTKKVIQTTSGVAEFSVQYDENGMLAGSGANEITVHYIYDESGQLTRTNDSFANYTSSYEYDSRGNMLSKKQYDYTTGDLNGLTPKETTAFTYANSGWKDQLVSVNGTPLTYDENGNLLTYGEKTYSWSHGTRLESIQDGENEYSYIYDENGTRFSKTVNGTTTQFAYLGGRLMAQKTGEDVFFFQCGAGGVPLGFVYNGVQYFYITNQLGDIIGITDATGKAIVEYSYDEWGNPIQTITRDNTAEQNKIAEINPLRYRGYYYDTETGYYYLQSRYYNPEWGRFLSPDAFGYIDNSTCLGFNAYIYCTNNPVMFVDYTGYYPKLSEVPPKSSGYVPPKGGAKQGIVPNGKLKGQKGWVDKDGWFWVPDKSDHGGEHWDVVDKKGQNHKNVYRDGHIREDKVDSGFSFNDILDFITSLLVPSDNVAAVIASLIPTVIVIACMLPFILFFAALFVRV